jgi:hypothetical protein
MSANGQTAWIAELQLTIYTMQLIATLSKQLIFNTMQLHYNCTHDVKLMSLIVIHLFKFDTWNYEKNWTTYFIFKILIFIVHYDYTGGPRLWHVA